ncbi:MAG: NADH dehydrogenase subunit, partial [Candidatus Poribacteria bacterium]
MDLKEKVQESGVVGAGGAGFPAHVKIDAEVEYVIANGAECEPLIHKDGELMERFAEGVVEGLKLVMAATGAQNGIIGIKEKKARAVEALKRATSGTEIKIHLLDDYYPAGDEVMLVYEATGRLILPGGIPLDIGVV